MNYELSNENISSLLLQIKRYQDFINFNFELSSDENIKESTRLVELENLILNVPEDYYYVIYKLFISLDKDVYNIFDLMYFSKIFGYSFSYAMLNQFDTYMRENINLFKKNRLLKKLMNVNLGPLSNNMNFHSALINYFDKYETAGISIDGKAYLLLPEIKYFASFSNTTSFQNIFQAEKEYISLVKSFNASTVVTNLKNFTSTNISDGLLRSRFNEIINILVCSDEEKYFTPALLYVPVKKSGFLKNKILNDIVSFVIEKKYSKYTYNLFMENLDLILDNLVIYLDNIMKTSDIVESYYYDNDTMLPLSDFAERYSAITPDTYIANLSDIYRIKTMILFKNLADGNQPDSKITLNIENSLELFRTYILDLRDAIISNSSGKFKERG